MPSVQFTDVEVIELPIVAGANHPSQDFVSDTEDDDEGVCKFCKTSFRTDDTALDSAAITLDWQAQTRTKVDLETYEREREKKNNGKLKRLTRAVRKRILRNVGIETSDIDSEDEYRTKKGKASKLPRLPVLPGQNLANKFRSQDRFASSEEGRQGSTNPDSTPSPPPSVASPTAPRRYESDDNHANTTVCMQDAVEAHPSSGASKRRRSITSAMVTLAKQPVKLAKRPVKLAKSTQKRLRKRRHKLAQARQVTKSQSDEDSLFEQDYKLVTLRRPSALLVAGGYNMGESDDEPQMDDRREDFTRGGKLLPAPSNCPPTIPRRYESESDQDLLVSPTKQAAEPISSPERKKRSLRVTSAIGILAKQPAKLAKQPVKLANSTRKRIMKTRKKKRQARIAEAQEENSSSSDGSVHCIAPRSMRNLYSQDFELGKDLYLTSSTNPVKDPHRVSGIPVSSSARAPVIPMRYLSSDDDMELATENLEANNPRTPGRRKRRGSLEHVANVIGILAYQPVRLAKQPVKLAKSTRRRLRRRKKSRRGVEKSASPHTVWDQEGAVNELRALGLSGSAIPSSLLIQRYGDDSIIDMEVEVEVEVYSEDQVECDGQHAPLEDRIEKEKQSTKTTRITGDVKKTSHCTGSRGALLVDEECDVESITSRKEAIGQTSSDRREEEIARHDEIPKTGETDSALNKLSTTRYASMRPQEYKRRISPAVKHSRGISWTGAVVPLAVEDNCDSVALE